MYNAYMYLFSSSTTLKINKQTNEQANRRTDKKQTQAVVPTVWLCNLCLTFYLYCTAKNV